MDLWNCAVELRYISVLDAVTHFQNQKLISDIASVWTDSFDFVYELDLTINDKQKMFTYLLSGGKLDEKIYTTLICQ